MPLDCPRCDVRMKVLKDNLRQEVEEIEYECPQCGAEYLRTITYKTQSRLVESDDLEEMTEEGSAYTTREASILEKAKEMIEDAGMSVESSEGDMPDRDGIERWCIHPENES